MALQFVAASTQYLSWAADLAGAPPFSVALWFNPASTAGYNMWSIGHTSVHTNAVIGTSGAGDPNCEQAQSGGNNSTAQSVTPMVNGTWYHLAAVFSSTTACTIYVNGVATNSSGGTVVSLAGCSVTYIAALLFGGVVQNYANGSIAYPTLWTNYALTSTDVNNLYNSGAGADPDTIQTAKIASLLYMQAASPSFDTILGANWTINGSPTVVADPFIITIPKPTVTVSAATLITQTSVTLNGAIAATGTGGNSTVEGFNWGTTPSLGGVVSSSGSFGVGSFSQPLTGLNPATIYYYQAFATNPGGTGTTTLQSFTTVIPPITVPEALLNGSQIGIAGGSGFPLSNLTDANALTEWSTFPTAGTAWAGVDAGAACALTRVRLSPYGGFEDEAIGANIQGSNSSTFVTPAVQYASNALSGVQTSITCNFATAQIAGDSNVVWVNPGAGGVTFGISDTLGNSYTQVQAPANGSNAAIFLANNIASATAAQNTVTVTFTSGNFPAIQACEYLGVITPGTIDSTSNNGGSGTAAATTITTTNASDIVIYFVQGGGIISTPLGYSIEGQQTVSSTLAVCAAQTVQTAGSYLISITTSVSGGWLLSAIALKIHPTFFVNTFLTITNRPLPGTLLNEYVMFNSPSFRYYRYLAPPGTFGSISDLDFIVQVTAGITAQVSTPTVSPPGGLYDLPLVVRISCTTAGSSLYYTTNGSTPTIASTLYTAPIVLSTSCTLKILGVQAGFTNSRIASYLFTIPSTIISSNDRFDNRNYKIWAFTPHHFYDPVGGWWYMYGFDVDAVGCFVNGWQGNNIYQSADLRNWTFVANFLGPPAGSAKNYGTYTGGLRAFYNAANNNYVFWLHNLNGMQVYTAPTPTGPFTQVGSNITNLDGNTQTFGDFTAFIDPVSGNGYIAYANPGAETSFTISLLNSSYTNTTGINFTNYVDSTAFGVASMEAPSLFYSGGFYFLLTSQVTEWEPNTNKYWWATSLSGSWTAGGNPFITNADPNSLGLAGTQYGVSQANSFTIAYDSQDVHGPLQIPGRGNNFIYLGDRYDNGIPNTTSHDPVKNMQAYRLLMMPMTISGHTLTIPWNNSWTFDGSFPTVTGPLAASGLNLTHGLLATWTNNEPKPAYIYLDNSSSFTFSTLVSELLPVGATSFQATVQSALWWRIRTVNASGTSLSLPFRFDPNVLPAVIVSATGYYVVLSIYGSYDAEYLTVGVDYSQSITIVESGPYQDYPTAFQALWAMLNPVFPLADPAEIPVPSQFA